MVLLHGGMLCPAEILALLSALPVAGLLWHYLRCRLSTLGSVLRGRGK